MSKPRDITELRGKVALLPDAPGVYQFLDFAGEVIYVGKAKNLKRRVSSYFMRKANHAPKVTVMVRKIADMRYTVVSSDSEAFLLENNMIKNLQPRYNVMLKDDKTYPWIVIRNEHFPRVQLTRRFVRDGSQYFGPYASVYIQKQILEVLKDLYMFRTCALNLAPEQISKGKYSVCLEYHIGNCKGPCVGNQIEDDYAVGINLAVELLKGNVRGTRQYLEQKMNEASDEMKFELAAAYKRRLEVLDHYQRKSVVVTNAPLDIDVFSIVADDDGAAYCNFMRVVSGSVVNTFTVELRPGVEDTPAEVLAYAINHIKDTIGKLSKEIIVPFIPACEGMEGVTFTVPHRGDKAKLLELSEQNCRLYRLDKLKQIEIKDPERHTNRVLHSLQKELYMDVQPRHIECFDNSNLQGTNPVAACVVFRDGKPSRKEYRHYNVKTVIGANDFASMEEIITRRYTRLMSEGAELPQLIVVDGGKGQLGYAYRVLQKLGLEDKIKIVGLAKRIEEVFFPNDPVPYYIDRNSPALRVLMHIRDEAHRFGITFHRQKRSINFIKSELENIPTLGSKSVEKLLKKFKTISRIKKATPEELTGVVGAKRAGEIVKYFSDGAGSNDQVQQNSKALNTPDVTGNPITSENDSHA